MTNQEELLSNGLILVSPGGFSSLGQVLCVQCHCHIHMSVELMPVVGLVIMSDLF